VKPLLLALFAASVLCAQESPPAKAPPEPRFVVRHDGEDLVLVTEGGAVSLDELAKRWSETTGRNFTYAPQLGRGPALVLTGAVAVKKADADYVFESLLVRAGFALVAIGPPDSKLFGVEQVENGRSLKQNAAFVAAGDLTGLARKPAQVFTTSFTLRNVVASAARASISQLLANRNAEMATEILSSNTLVVTAFGPTLVAVKGVVEAADRPAPAAPQTVETVILKHAVAAEVSGVIDAVLRAKEPTRPQQPGEIVVERIETRVVADSRTNSVIVQGTEDAVAAAKRLIAALDLPVGK
jgi:type II secretory pathway component GspD/PulD (secretin)